MQNKYYTQAIDDLEAVKQHAERLAGLLPDNDPGFAYVIGQRVRVALGNLEAALLRCEEPPPSEAQITMDALNADLTLDNVDILWTGSTVQLLLDGKIMTTLDATANIQDKIARWCAKNHYRCTRLHDGKIWL